MIRRAINNKEEKMPVSKSVLSILLSAVFVFSACPGEERGEGPVVLDAGDNSCSLDDPYTLANDPNTAPLLADNSAPRLDCAIDAPVWPESIPVAMGGCLDVFGLGSRITATTLKVAVFDADQNPQTDTPAYGVTDVETSSPEAVACPKGAYYRINNIPTSTPLLVKVYDSDRRPSMVVIDSLQYNVLLDPADITINGGEFVDFEANVIYSATYQSLPTLAGRPVDGMQDISDGVGRGVIAGEAHDCDGQVMQNVVLDGPCFDSSSKRVYTVGEDCDQPNPRQSTGECGTYVYLNVEPGLHRVEGYYLDGSSNQLLGSADIYVFPDTVTIFTPKGLSPVVGNVDAGMANDAAMNNDATMDDAALVEDAAMNNDATMDDAALVEDAGIDADAGAEDAGLEDVGAEDAGVAEDI